MLKIAVSGKMGSGKNLFLDIARKLSFAESFKEIKFAKEIYNISYQIQNYLGLPPEKDGNLLQFLGKHYRDKEGGDFWVNKCFEINKPFDTSVIITDLRYPEELEAVQREGFITIRILRQIELRLNNLGNRNLNHESETALDHLPNSAFDYTINNNGTLELFESAVSQILREVRRKK